MKKLSLCMIVKNEEKFLPKCLESVKDIVEEMIIVDTGSTDKTIEIAEKYGAKTYYYKWKNNFSLARNYSISKATGEWLLLLDADEVLAPDCKEKLRALLNNTSMDAFEFCIQNFKSIDNNSNIITHYALRLIKNDKRFRYKGAIHEQLQPVNKETPYPKVDICDVVLYHYGYMDEVVAEKNKRSRNIPLIKKQLKKDPHNPYYTFTLANEYMSQNKLEEAVTLYEEAFQYSKQIMKFHPYAYHRIIMCSYFLRNYEYALEKADTALSLFPKCTDYEYCKGLIYLEMHKTTLAVDSFKKCINMGIAPSFLTFVNECATVKPTIQLGNIYYQLEDYRSALRYYTKAINMNSTLYLLLYPIGHCFKMIFNDPNIISKQLKAFFTDFSNYRNVLLYTDVLLKEKLFSSAKEGLNTLKNFNETTHEENFLSAKLDFYTLHYKTAYEKFNKIRKNNIIPSFVNLTVQENLKFLFLIELIQKQEISETLFEEIKSLNNKTFVEVCSDIIEIMRGAVEIDESYLSTCETPALKLSIIMDFFDQLLILKEYNLFEKLLPILNRVDSNQVLIETAKLLQRNNYKDMAACFILKSIKELNTFDYNTLEILATNLALKKETTVRRSI